MSYRPSLPVALTIAGSDSGGGAGVQADLATFASLDVYGTCAVTCITAQNPWEVAAVQPCSPPVLRAQLKAVAEYHTIRAAKSGMLLEGALVREAARFFAVNRRIPLVIDPVMFSTSGAELLKPSALSLLLSDLLPLATLITPNRSEAEALLTEPIRSPEALRQSAREIHRRFGVACLVKGGHMRGTSGCVDFFCDGRVELLLESRREQIKGLPGTGCTVSAAITGHLAHRVPLIEAVQLAKDYITQAIVHRRKVGRHFRLNHRLKERAEAGRRTRSARG